MPASGPSSPQPIQEAHPAHVLPSSADEAIEVDDHLDPDFMYPGRT